MFIAADTVWYKRVSERTTLGEVGVASMADQTDIYFEGAKLWFIKVCRFFNRKNSITYYLQVIRKYICK